MRRILSILKIAIPVALAAYLMYYTFEDPQRRLELREAVSQMNLFWIYLSIVLAWLSHVVRAQRWKYLLIPLGYETRLWNRYHSIMAGYLINMVLPRVGEASRAAITAKYEKTPVDRTFGTIAAERIVDLVILVGIIALTVYSERVVIGEKIMELMDQGGVDTPDNTKYYILGIGAVVALLIFFVLGATIREKVMGFLKGIMEGMLSIFKSKYRIRFLADTFLIWGLYLLMFFAPFQALESTAALPSGAIMAAFVFGSLAVVLTPGGTGSYHLMVGLALSYYGLSVATGQALGLVIWAGQAFMLIALGALSLLLLPSYNREYAGHTAISVSEDISS